MREVRIYGDPVLRKKAKPVTVFDDALVRFVGEMIETMREKDGVGLAAPQVGESVCVVVIDATGGELEPLVLINPEITFSSDDTLDTEEGCLSIPDISLKICRPSRVSVTAFDARGKKFIIDNAEGLLARALQHEIDHLNGILFVDRAPPVSRQLIAGKLKKLAKNSGETISAP